MNAQALELSFGSTRLLISRTMKLGEPLHTSKTYLIPDESAALLDVDVNNDGPTRDLGITYSWRSMA